jgi:hypothetical protein
LGIPHGLECMDQIQRKILDIQEMKNNHYLILP